MKKGTILFLSLFFASNSLLSQSAPTYLTAVSGDEEVMLTWLPPNTFLTEGETCELPLSGGTIVDGYAEIIQGSNVNFENDFQNGGAASGKDVVYQFNVLGNLDVTFSFCDPIDGGTNDGASWDTYLLLYGDDCETLVASNDDFCGLRSEISGTLSEGTYYLVVDGYSADEEGEFELQVNASSSAREFGHFNQDQTIIEKITDRELEGSNIIALDEYSAGSEQTIDFILTVVSADVEYVDGFSLSFPDDWEIIGGSSAQEQAVNVDENIITFGNPDAGSQFGAWNIDEHPFSVTLMPSNDASGDISVTYYIGGDQYEPAAEPHFVEGSLILSEYIPSTGDLLGYNIYKDNSLHNSSIVVSNSYRVDGLTNGTEYSLGVTAVYFVSDTENNESVPVTVLSTPNFIYGDISGIVSDVNGSPIYGAIVRASGISDTTDADGAYLISNLNIGNQIINVSANNFYTESAIVNVLAQAEPIVQNFTLSPDLPSPVALSAIPGDEKVSLSWRSPGSLVEYDLAYYDELFEDPIGCGGGGCMFGVRFTPSAYPATLQHIVISIQGFNYDGYDYGGESSSAEIMVYLDPSSSIDGPSGTPDLILDNVDLSTDGSETTAQFLLNLGEQAIDVLSGDIYIIIDDGGGFLSLSNDTEPSSPNNFDRNWINVGGGWGLISSGYPDYAGDFGILAGFIGVPGVNDQQSFALSSLYGSNNNVSSINANRVTNAYIDSNFEYYPSSQFLLDGLYNVRPIPNHNQSNMRDETITGYNIYQVNEDLSSTIIATIEASDSGLDSNAIISGLANYTNYCFHVKAQWDSDDYGLVESKSSNVACATPFAVGDSNFDNDITIEDVLTLVDFILEETTPSSAAFNNSDINMDDELNIADVVMVVDIISGSSTARLANYGSFASVDLIPNYNTSDLTFNLSYDGGLKGLEFDIEYDSDLLSLNAPSLVVMQENVVSTFNHLEDGLIKVIVFDVTGDFIIPNENNDLLKMSFNFFGNVLDESSVNVNNVIVSGPKGSIANVSSNVVSAAIKLVPGVFALHQNYPNPFNPNTEIRFDIPEATTVDISIFNLMGQKIKILKNEKIQPGYHTVQWDGTNDNGMQVSTGMYFYTLQTEVKSAMRKMLFLK